MKTRYFTLREGRDYGIDLLRIAAMLMVVVLHVLGHGGVLGAKDISGANYWAAWFLNIACYCAVDIYALISGFVGYRVKHGYAGIAELWLRVALYSVSFAVLYRLLFPSETGWLRLLFSFFPVTRGELWYFTMYFGLFFLTPVLNAAVQAMPEKLLRNTVWICVFLFCVLPFLWNRDTFCLKDGYSLMWLLVLYLAGAYIGKYRAFANMRRAAALLGYLLCVFTVWSSKYVLQNLFPRFLGQENSAGWLIRYTSLPVFLSAVFLLLFFRGLRLPVFGKRIVAALSPLTFSVFVIHVLPPVWDRLLYNRFASFAGFSLFGMAAAVVGAAAAVYLACSAIDFLRAMLFDLLRVKERLKRLEARLFGPPQ